MSEERETFFDRFWSAVRGGQFAAMGKNEVKAWMLLLVKSDYASGEVGMSADELAGYMRTDLKAARQAAINLEGPELGLAERLDEGGGGSGRVARRRMLMARPPSGMPLLDLLDGKTGGENTPVKNTPDAQGNRGDFHPRTGGNFPRNRGDFPPKTGGNFPPRSPGALSPHTPPAGPVPPAPSGVDPLIWRHGWDLPPEKLRVFFYLTAKERAVYPKRARRFAVLGIDLPTAVRLWTQVISSRRIGSRVAAYVDALNEHLPE